MYAIRKIPGRGKGLIATRKIPQGTLILSEEPMIKIRESALDTGLFPDRNIDDTVRCHVKELSSRDQKKFLTLHRPRRQPDDLRPSNKYFATFKVNKLFLETSFPAESSVYSEGSDAFGIFMLASRINHDCFSNTHNTWNANTERYTVYASRDIAAGEEITISYAGPFATPHENKGMLLAKYGFECTCPLCSLPRLRVRDFEEHALQASQRMDAVLISLNRMRSDFGLSPITPVGYKQTTGGGRIGGFREMLRIINDSIHFFDSEDMPAQNAVALSVAAKVCSLHGDLARCSEFWKLAADYWMMLEGKDSPRCISSRSQALNPQRDVENPEFEKWASEKQDVPQLPEDEFQEWLWMETCLSQGKSESLYPRVHRASVQSKSKDVSKKRKRSEDNNDRNTKRPALRKKDQSMDDDLAKLHNFRSLRGDDLPDPNFEGDLGVRKYYGTERVPQLTRFFVAEIVAIRRSPRMELDVKDVDGKVFEVTLARGETGYEVDESLVRTGHTYASLHVEGEQHPSSPWTCERPKARNTP